MLQLALPHDQEKKIIGDDEIDILTAQTIYYPLKLN